MPIPDDVIIATVVAILLVLALLPAAVGDDPSPDLPDGGDSI